MTEAPVIKQSSKVETRDKWSRVISPFRQDCYGVMWKRGLDHLPDYWGQVGNIATPANPTGLLHFASFGIHTKYPGDKQDGDEIYFALKIGAIIIILKIRILTYIEIYPLI